MALANTHKKRLRQTLSCLRPKRLDGLLIGSAVNIFYLTGLENIEGYLLVSDKKCILFTDFRYKLTAQKRCRDLGLQLVIYSFGLFEHIAKEIKKAGLTTVGCEAKILSYKECMEFKKNFEARGLRLTPTTDLIKKLRAIKERDEIDLMRSAVKASLTAFDFLTDVAYEGLTERYLCDEAEHFLKASSDPEVAFRPIVASGRSSAQPHYAPRRVKITASLPILVDLGAKYPGYCSDLTRLLFLSKMPTYINKLISIIMGAQEKSIRKISDGVKASDVDRVARSYIEKKGYGRFFGHSLGHGVGLEVHELPSLNSKSQEVLKEGMVVTVEPGIYLPGKFGVRLESMVLVKKGKSRVLDR